MDNPVQQWLLMVLNSIMMVKDNNPSMVHHARVWSRASTVQLVLGGSAAVQCFNSKQLLHCKKDLTS